MNHRVVITGMGGVTAFGENWSDISARIRAGKNAVQHMPDWQIYEDLHTQLAAPILGEIIPAHYTRKQLRSMGRVAILSTRASELALMQAGLLEESRLLSSGSVGVAYGSSTGSTKPISDLASLITEKHTRNITTTTYVQLMSHTSPLAMAISAGGYLEPKVATSAVQTLQCPIHEVYGSTETGVVAWRKHPWHHAKWTLFSPLGLQQISEKNHYLLHSPLLPPPYTFLLSDKLRVYDGGATFDLLGRVDRIVKIEEKRVALNQIEAALCTLEGVEAAYAMVVSHGRQQRIGVVIVPIIERYEALDRIKKEAKNLLGHLPAVAYPHYWRCVKEFPLTSQGKIDTPALRALFYEN